MKKIIFIIAMFFAFGAANAQTWSNSYSGRTKDVFVISSWHAFSGDSSATVYTPYINPAPYDSVKVFIYPTLSAPIGQADTSKFTATLQGNMKMLINGSYQASPYTYSLGTVMDTTNAKKINTLMQVTQGLVTQNMDMFRIALTGSTVAVPNSKRDIITIWLVGYKSKAAINYTAGQ